MELDARQLDTLRHMLGINDPSMPEPKHWRNYAAVNPGDPHFVKLAELGAVRLYRRAGAGSDYDYYECTQQGIDAAVESFKSIQLPKSKRVYRKWLDVRDALGDVSFKEFLTDPIYSESRRAA